MSKKKNKLVDLVEQYSDDSQSGPGYEVCLEPEVGNSKTKMRFKSYRLDLRIHSPSALGYLGIKGIDTAPALVRLARVKGLDVIAVTDFHSGDYIDRLVTASQDSGVTVLPGLLLRTKIKECNDVTLMCLFPDHFDTAATSQLLTELQVPQSAKGDSSFIVPIDFEEVIKKIEAHQGLIVPSRMDKTPYQREAIPVLVEKYGFRAFDLAYHPESLSFFKERWPKIKFQLLSFSNANALAQVGSRVSKVKMDLPGFAGLSGLVEREAEILEAK